MLPELLGVSGHLVGLGRSDGGTVDIRGRDSDVRYVPKADIEPRRGCFK